jgi:hypothetical protein
MRAARPIVQWGLPMNDQFNRRGGRHFSSLPGGVTSAGVPVQLFNAAEWRLNKQGDQHPLAASPTLQFCNAFGRDNGTGAVGVATPDIAKSRSWAGAPVQLLNDFEWPFNGIEQLPQAGVRCVLCNAPPFRGQLHCTSHPPLRITQQGLREFPAVPLHRHLPRNCSVRRQPPRSRRLSPAPPGQPSRYNTIRPLQLQIAHHTRHDTLPTKVTWPDGEHAKPRWCHGLGYPRGNRASMAWPHHGRVGRPVPPASHVDIRPRHARQPDDVTRRSYHTTGRARRSAPVRNQMVLSPGRQGAASAASACVTIASWQRRTPPERERSMASLGEVSWCYARLGSPADDMGGMPARCSPEQLAHLLSAAVTSAGYRSSPTP